MNFITQETLKILTVDTHISEAYEKEGISWP